MQIIVENIKMGFVKHSEGEIVSVIKSNDDIDNEKTEKALKEAKESIKNLDKDGNKTEFSKESE